MNYENTVKTFSERLRALRAEAKLTQKQCAEQLGVETYNYNKWENEVSPPLGMICKIAEHFSVTTDYLLGLEDSRTHDGQAVFKELGLSDKAIRILRENKPKAHPERIGREGLWVYKNDLPDGAYSIFINALLEWEVLSLANDFSTMMELTGDHSVTYSHDGIPSEPNFYSPEYLEYRCLKRFIIFLDIAKTSIPPENIEGGDLYEMIAKLHEREE